PTVLCREANLKMSSLSRLIRNWMVLLQRLQTPSNRIILFFWDECILFFLTMLFFFYQLQLFHTDVRGKNAIIDDGLIFFEAINAPYGLSVGKPYSIPHLK